MKRRNGGKAEGRSCFAQLVAKKRYNGLVVVIERSFRHFLRALFFSRRRQSRRRSVATRPVRYPLSPSVWFLNNSSNIRGIFSLDPLENALPIAFLSQQTPFEQTKRLNASIYPLRKDGIRTC